MAILSTDINMEDDEIVRIYGKRWDIEVFFKMCKSFLNLAKEFQGRSYDSMIAHTTIVFCRYMMLTVEKRDNEDSRTFGILFYECCDEVKDIQYIEALSLLLKLLKEYLHTHQLIPDDKIQALIDAFISVLPAFFKAKLLKFKCES
ncbi:transposase, IS4 family protein [Candidatus Magnetobacterium bavaricum]|uniref:Transposase, IS4 family protein n=1 Tax=Candidatus Magnetobacterium bavaricum TaxID=29290 RepID=A0A0F3GRC6_9BACT|nr:transposase, IS4 family protein [Candidatus Magnetobacterium bavaricum]